MLSDNGYTEVTSKSTKKVKLTSDKDPVHLLIKNIFMIPNIIFCR